MDYLNYVFSTLLNKTLSSLGRSHISSCSESEIDTSTSIFSGLKTTSSILGDSSEEILKTSLSLSDSERSSVFSSKLVVVVSPRVSPPFSSSLLDPRKISSKV